jgi:Raf kinase inhibitor-like YbhB/YbcL family protein
MDLTRRAAPDPYDSLPERPWFQVTSDDFTDGARLDDRFAQQHDNESPHLRWSGAPAGTQGFAVTCFDPDAPTSSGWWHWLLVDLPAETTELPHGAGGGAVALPGGAFHVRNDAGNQQYDGPAPPPGDGDHRYVFVVHALDVPSLQVQPDTPAAQVGIGITFHTLARGRITGTWSR